MDRQIIEGMLGDALEREIITAKMVDGAYPPAVAVGILDGRGGEIGFGHGESQLTVILPDIGDCARFVDSCKALGGKVPLGTYGGELVSAMARELERELNATVKKQAEADRYAAEQAAEADLYKRTKQAEAARIERQNQSDAELYSAQKDAEGIQARAKAEAEATRLKGESEGAAEKAHGEGVAAGIKAQAEAYNGMDNPYLLANRYIDIMPKVAEQVAKPLTAVDSIKMYGSGNAQKLVKETTSIVDQVASGLKDSTGIDLPSLLNGLISNPDIDVDSAENSVE